jgi:hypothetical protein
MASRGRPPTGRSGDKSVTVYLPPEDVGVCSEYVCFFPKSIYVYK